MNFSPDIPKLIDENAGYYLYQTLQQCHENRVQLYSKVFNISIIVIFVIVSAFILYFCFHRKKTTQERQQDIVRDQQIILEKIKALQDEKKKMIEHQSMTNLPITGNTI